MASHPGIYSLSLSPMIKQQDARDGLVQFVVGLGTVVGTATYSMHGSHAPFSYFVLGVRGIMTAAGGAGDTVQVFNGVAAITEQINLAALADTATFQAQTIDNANWMIRNYIDDLVIVTTGGALCIVICDCLRAEFTGGI